MSTPNPQPAENSTIVAPTSQNQDDAAHSLDLETLVEELPQQELEKLSESYDKSENKEAEENNERECDETEDLEASMSQYISNIPQGALVKFHDPREDNRNQNTVETKILKEEGGLELQTLVTYQYENEQTSPIEHDENGVPYDFIEFEPSNRLPLMFSLNLKLQWITKSLEIDAPQKISQAKNVLLSQTAMSIEKASLALGILSDSATVLKSSLVDFFTDKANRLLNRSDSLESAHNGLEPPWMEDTDPLLPPQSPQAQTEQTLVETKENDQKKNTKP